MKSRTMTILGAAALNFLILTSSHASDVDVLINKLVERNILTRIDADAIRSEIVAEKKSGAVTAEEKANFTQMMKESAPWLDGLTSKGDVRLRGESFELENEDGRDRNRFRFRLRWGLEKKFNDEWKAGFRLASGSATDAASTNQSFDDEFNYKSIFIDRAYGIYNPAGIKSALHLSGAEIGAGKMANPYEKWGTSIVWDSDVSPEGIYEKMDWKLADIGDPAKGGKLELNTLLGQFVLNENSTGQDSNLYAYGIGTNVAWDKSRNWQSNFTYYDWSNYTDLVKSGSVLTAANPGGNDREVDNFKVLSFYTEANMPISTFWGSQNLKLFGHYIHNTDEGEKVDGEPMTPNGNRDDGYSAGVQLGKSKAKGEWEAKYQYYFLEANATPGNFTESDLGLGFANNQGHQWQYAYRLLDNLQLAGSLWFVERIDRTTAADDQDRQVWRWNIDLVYSF